LTRLSPLLALSLHRLARGGEKLLERRFTTGFRLRFGVCILFEIGVFHMETQDNELNKEYRQNCLEVGHLMVAINRLENLLTTILKLHLAINIGSVDIPSESLESKRTMGLASAIYGGLRYSASRDTLNRLMAVEKPIARSLNF